MKSAQNSASGKTGINQRIKPRIPIFTITPLNTIVVAAGACSYASGCHVCKGNIGILMAKATKKNQNAHGKPLPVNAY